MSRRQDAEVLDPQVMDDVEFLQGIRSYLESHGWTQREYEDYHGSVCLLGAVMEVATLRALPLSAATRMMKDLLGFDGTSSAVNWNDEVGRQESEVFERIDKAIERRLKT